LDIGQISARAIQSRAAATRGCAAPPQSEPDGVRVAWRERSSTSSPSPRGRGHCVEGASRSSQAPGRERAWRARQGPSNTPRSLRRRLRRSMPLLGVTEGQDRSEAW